MSEKEYDDETTVDSLADFAEYRSRMRNERADLIEELIQDGFEQGHFDNLPGKGKPLNLNKNPYAADMELANELLKENDLPPVWILQRNEILAKVARLRAEIERQWTWHQREFGVASVNKDRLTISWDDYCLKWIEEIAELNKAIDAFNLKRPFENMEIFKLTIENELKRANAPRWLR
ncbi:DnaJ family domain-containing protein [Candidatus Leptofilum sp.]|uniref:DnaJ family domain-containing protein n=1 Tax=Candidatus Leptofilum sp. TaxID=3241576 RepID=UPI003B59A9EF